MSGLCDSTTGLKSGTGLQFQTKIGGAGFIISGGPPEQRIWPTNPTPASPAVSDGGTNTSVALGMFFKSSAAGVIKGAYVFVNTANQSASLSVVLANSTTILANQSFIPAVGGGWQRFNFTTPVAILANTPYMIWQWVPSIGAPGPYYAATASYFTTGPGVSGVDSGKLHAYSNAEAATLGTFQGNSAVSQDQFTVNAAATVAPSSLTGGTNYWVDPIFQ